MPKRKRTRKSGVYKRRVGIKKTRSSSAVSRRALRRKRNKATVRTIKTTGQGYPERLRVKLVYDQNNFLTSTGGATTNQIFHGNNPYDPDVTGSGAQPMWYDQYAGIYESVRVYGSSCKVTVTGKQGNTADFVQMSIVPSKSVTAFTNAITASEQPYAVTWQNNLISRRKKYMAVAKLWGDRQRDVPVNSSQYQFLTSGATVPFSPFYWHITATSADFASTTSVNVHARITYYCEFIGRLRPAQS